MALASSAYCWAFSPPTSKVFTKLTPSHDPLLYPFVATPTKFDPMNKYELSRHTSRATATTMAAFDLRGSSTMPMR